MLKKLKQELLAWFAAVSIVSFFSYFSYSAGTKYIVQQYELTGFNGAVTTYLFFLAAWTAGYYFITLVIWAIKEASKP